MRDTADNPDLGYIFHPSETRHYPIFHRLDVVITEPPTHRHFDPEKVKYWVVSPAGLIEQLTIHHPWTLGNQYRVCVGRIFITDRVGKKVEAFSFGGKLEILPTREQTICSLTSAAPIFDLCSTHNVPMWFTSEVEILLAEQKAHWSPAHPEGIESGVVKADPLLLYACCLQTLSQKKWPTGEEEYREGSHFVQSEIKRVRESGAWPAMVPSLTQLLHVS